MTTPLTLELTITHETDENGWITGTTRELPCIITCGRTTAEVNAQLADALTEWKLAIQNRGGIDPPSKQQGIRVLP